MKNIQEKMGTRFSRVQDGIDKGRGKVEEIKEKSKINKEISGYQVEKSNILLNMGMLLYEKIRKEEIQDNDFNELSLKIIELDKMIYESNSKIKELEELQREDICECGNIININDKFCASCGNKVEIEENIKEYNICDICEAEIDLDCNYCECCGVKLKDN